MIAPADPGLAAVLRALRRRGGAAARWYKDGCLVRRIELRMRARKVPTITGYASLLTRDPAEAEQLLDALSIRVTGFFRDPDSWRRLGDLLDSDPVGREPPRQAWSMGCSTGEEAWSLALLIRQRIGPDRSGFRVLGSDLDETALRFAEAGCYSAAAGEAIRGFLGQPGGIAREGRFQVDPGLRARVRFVREDLTRTRREPETFDLVCCRNVLIFMGREGQRRILEQARRALRPGGLLMLGRTESLAALGPSGFVSLDTSHRIYQRTP